MPTGSGLVIEVFADIWCPFAHAGLHELRAQIEESGRTDVVVRVRAWPLELINGHPQDPVTTVEHAAELREQVAPSLFQHFDVDHFPASTLEALALVERAYRIDPASGERASFDLRHALFESGQDVSDLAVLERIASQLGVPMPDDDDRAAVLADWDDGQSRGVVGSPHYFCGDADAFCPSLDISREAGGGLSITRDTARMADFLARCLALTPTPPADGSGTESGHG